MLDIDIIKDNGNDPIAILTVINTFLVKRILVDDESVVQVLMWKAFKEMGLDESQFRLSGPIYGFTNQPIKEKVIITFPITFGQREHFVIVTADFLVVIGPRPIMLS